MSQNPQEITEAKLAAFIDGELGADERAEIEALLARKPQYRPLLAELGRTRDLLRTLPRETAPPPAPRSLGRSRPAPKFSARPPRACAAHHIGRRRRAARNVRAAC